jgi:hypothetical protein
MSRQVATVVFCRMPRLFGTWSTASALGISLFDMKYSVGALPHEKLLRSIELYGSKVIPMVRDILN